MITMANMFETIEAKHKKENIFVQSKRETKKDLEKRLLLVNNQISWLKKIKTTLEKQIVELNLVKEIKK